MATTRRKPPESPEPDSPAEDRPPIRRVSEGESGHRYRFTGETARHYPTLGDLEPGDTVTLDGKVQDAFLEPLDKED